MIIVRYAKYFSKSFFVATKKDLRKHVLLHWYTVLWLVSVWHVTLILCCDWSPPSICYNVIVQKDIIEIRMGGPITAWYRSGEDMVCYRNVDATKHFSKPFSPLAFENWLVVYTCHVTSRDPALAASTWRNVMIIGSSLCLHSFRKIGAHPIRAGY